MALGLLLSFILAVHQNHLLNLFKYRFPGPIQREANSLSLGWSANVLRGCMVQWSNVEALEPGSLDLQ